MRVNVFYIGNDKNVHYLWWKGERPNEWGIEKKPVSTLSCLPGPIAAVSMNSQHLEVFWTAADGSIYHAYWYENTGTWDSRLLGQGV